MNNTDAPIAPKSKLSALLDRLVEGDERATANLRAFRDNIGGLKRELAETGKMLADARRAFSFEAIRELAAAKAKAEAAIEALGKPEDVEAEIAATVNTPDNFATVAEALRLRASEAIEVRDVRLLALADAARDSVKAGASPAFLFDAHSRGYAELVVANDNFEAVKGACESLARARNRAGDISEGAELRAGETLAQFRALLEMPLSRGEDK